MKRPPLIAIPLFLGAMLAGALAYLYLTGDRLPELTAERLEAAKGRWQREGLASYDLRLEMQGSELGKGVYEVAVRRGETPSVIRDGLATTGDPGVYTVEGLHAVLEQELRLAQEPQRAFGAPEGYRAYLHARFDERGVPVGYRRVVGGANRWSEWRVMALDPR